MQKERQGKYVFVVVKGHAMADSRGRVLEHRWVMSEHLGRQLQEDEVVHHIDGNRFNNSISNLEVMTSNEHRRVHGKFMDFECPQCGKIFERALRNARGKRTFCSRRCAVTFYHAERRRNSSD